MGKPCILRAKARWSPHASRDRLHQAKQIHPFPSTRDIIQSIPHGQKIFEKLDAVHGYFQLALDEESSYLTTFLLPQGRFRYLRAPMGLNASSDEWCRHSAVAVEGLEWCMKIVDDIIIWATTTEEMWSRINIVLERCKAHNITISRKNWRSVKKLNLPDMSSAIKGFNQILQNSELLETSQHQKT